MRTGFERTGLHRQGARPLTKYLERRILVARESTLAQSGFGCSPTARGRSILCVCLGDGEQTRWNRNDFIGVLKDEFLPDWAKESLKQYQRAEQTEKQEMQMGGM